MTLTDNDKAQIFNLLTAKFDDMKRHYSVPDDMFELDGLVWAAPDEFVWEFFGVDRAFQFKRMSGVWNIREVWIADDTEMRAVCESNGGTWIFDVEARGARARRARIYAAP